MNSIPITILLMGALIQIGFCAQYLKEIKDMLKNNTKNDRRC